jgi:nucleoside-diphosphate-sugar epimerase
MQMLEYCRAKNAWFIFISSRGVAKLDSLYSISKHTGELMCYQYARDYGMKIMIIRLGDVVEEVSDKVFNVIKRKLKRNEPVHLTNPQQQFDFITVKQVIKAIHSSIDKLERTKYGFCDRIDVTSGELTSLEELYNKLKEEYESSRGNVDTWE